jgi:hypothetical protein
MATHAHPLVPLARTEQWLESQGSDPRMSVGLFDPFTMTRSARISPPTSRTFLGDWADLYPPATGEIL